MKTRNSWAKNKIKKVATEILRKMLKYICIFLTCCLVIYNILYLFNSVFRNKKYAQIFNLYISTEKENSMSPAIRKNSLIIGCKIKNVNEGEIVGYDIDNTIKYHRLSKIKNNDGKTTYITKADNNYREDLEGKKFTDIKAKIIIKIPVIGWLFIIFESKITTVIVVILLCLRFSYNSYRIQLTKKRKSEKENSTK